MVDILKVLGVIIFVGILLTGMTFISMYIIPIALVLLPIIFLVLYFGQKTSQTATSDQPINVPTILQEEPELIKTIDEINQEKEDVYYQWLVSKYGESEAQVKFNTHKSSFNSKESR